MDEQDTLDIAVPRGLPWIDLSLVHPERIEATESGPLVHLTDNLKLAVSSGSFLEGAFARSMRGDTISSLRIYFFFSRKPIFPGTSSRENTHTVKTERHY